MTRSAIRMLTAVSLLGAAFSIAAPAAAESLIKGDIATYRIEGSSAKVCWKSGKCYDFVPADRYGEAASCPNAVIWHMAEKSANMRRVPIDKVAGLGGLQDVFDRNLEGGTFGELHRCISRDGWPLDIVGLVIDLEDSQSTNTQFEPEGLFKLSLRRDAPAAAPAPVAKGSNFNPEEHADPALPASSNGEMTAEDIEKKLYGN